MLNEKDQFDTMLMEKQTESSVFRDRFSRVLITRGKRMKKSCFPSAEIHALENLFLEFFCANSKICVCLNFLPKFLRCYLTIFL